MNQRLVVSSQRPAVNGQYSTASGQRPAANGHQPTVKHQRPAISSQQSAVTFNGQRALTDNRRLLWAYHDCRVYWTTPRIVLFAPPASVVGASDNLNLDLSREEEGAYPPPSPAKLRNIRKFRVFHTRPERDRWAYVQSPSVCFTPHCSLSLFYVLR